MSEMQSFLGLDEVDTTGAYDHLLGKVVEFRDIDLSSGSQLQSETTGMPISARFVKNDSGGTLAKNLLVAWKSGYVGTRVGGLCAVSPARPAGVVTSYAGATIADGANFWMIISGPCKMVSDGASTMAITDQITPAGSGKVKKVASGTAATLPGLFGEPMEAVTNVDGTVFRGNVWINCC